jgi:hypothetical protein
MSRNALTMLIVALAIWLALCFLTETLDPLSQVQQLLAAGFAEVQNVRLTDANLDSAGNCVDSPEDLAAAASATLGQPVSVEEYALARMVACESVADLKGGSDADKVARIWVALNDAAANNGGDIVQCLTGGHGFGPEGPRKYATGRNDPTDYHLALVRACVSGAIPDPTGGATHFLDKYGFADADHKYDPNAYAAAVAKWTGYGWHRVLVIGKGLEIWT